MSSKAYLLAFNNQLNEFIEDINLIFPNDVDIKNAKNSIILMKKMNPTIIIKSWYLYIYKPYNPYIEEQGIEFIINKDYSEDIKLMDDSSKILEVIERIRKPIKNCSDDNKEKCLNYITNLNKLSNLYNNSN
tara:strand:+ start:2271 stop:2666 length:396 start_codon:yes stop_codon:yes gene_type:complete